MSKFKLIGAAVALTISSAALAATAADCCQDMACCKDGADCCDCGTKAKAADCCDHAQGSMSRR